MEDLLIQDWLYFFDILTGFDVFRTKMFSIKIVSKDILILLGNNGIKSHFCYTGAALLQRNFKQSKRKHSSLENFVQLFPGNLILRANCPHEHGFFLKIQLIPLLRNSSEQKAFFIEKFFLDEKNLLNHFCNHQNRIPVKVFKVMTASLVENVLIYQSLKDIGCFLFRLGKWWKLLIDGNSRMWPCFLFTLWEKQTQPFWKVSVIKVVQYSLWSPLYYRSSFAQICTSFHWLWNLCMEN